MCMTTRRQSAQIFSCPFLDCELSSSVSLLTVGNHSFKSVVVIDRLSRQLLVLLFRGLDSWPVPRPRRNPACKKYDSCQRIPFTPGARWILRILVHKSAHPHRKPNHEPPPTNQSTPHISKPRLHKPAGLPNLWHNGPQNKKIH